MLRAGFDPRIALGTRRIVLPRLLKAIQVEVVASKLGTPIPGCS